MDQAIEWAREAGLKVWVDLHGAPGSQNGFDNSGLRDHWGFQTGDNVNITLDVLEYLAEKYGSSEYSGVVTSIELLNEPLGPALDMDEIKNFYNTGYDLVRSASDTVGVTIHDAFMDYNYWNEFLTLPEDWFVTLDHHQYQIFASDQLARTIDEHVEYACSLGNQTKTEYHWRITGEFAAALTDCTKWVNGVGRGARYDGTFNTTDSSSYYIGSCDNINDVNYWTTEQIQDSRRYMEAQLDAWDQGAGWIYWTYKTESAFEWDFRRLVNAGIIPYPFDERQYPNQCGF